MTQWNSKALFLGVLLAVILCNGQSIHAGQTTYTNGAANDQWNDPANWSAGLPDSTSDVILPTPFPGGSGGSIVVNSGSFANTITINDAYTLNSGSLTITTGDITVAPTITANISSVIQGTGGFTKLGTGILVLSGANTVIGNFEINEGTLRFGALTNINTISLPTFLGTATTVATLDYTGNSAIISRVITLGSLAGSATGNTINVATTGQVLTLSGRILGGAAATNTSLTLTGAGAVLLSNNVITAGNENTFTGNIVVDGGRLNIVGLNGANPGEGFMLGGGVKSVILQNGGRFLNSTTTFNPIGASKSIIIGTGGGTIDASAQITLDDAGQFGGTSGGGSLTKAGNGVLVLTQNFATYDAAQTFITAGTIELRNSDALGDATPAKTTINMSGGTLDLRNDATANYGYPMVVTGNAAVNVTRNGGSNSNQTHTLGTLSIGTNTLTVTGGNGFALIAGAATLSGNPTFATTSANLTLASVATGAVDRTITKTGNNFLMVTGGTNSVGTTTLTQSAGGVLSGTSTALGAVILATTTGTLSEYIQNGAPTTGSSYSIPVDGIIAGDAAYLSGLIVGTNLNGFPNTIGETVAGANNSINATNPGTLPNDASRFFAIAGTVTGETASVGAGTPWIGISNDRITRTFSTGTITPNSDFSIRATNAQTFVLGNGGTASQVTFTTAAATKATIVGGTIQLNDTTGGYTSDLTFEVASGATLQTVSAPALGTSGTSASNAKVNVLSGGVLNPNAGTTVNGNAVIQMGGILNIDDATNLTGIGTITQFAGSVTRITNNAATALSGAQSPGTVPGSIVQLQNNLIGSLVTKIDNAAIFSVFNASRLLAAGNSLNLNSTGGLTGVLTNDGANRVLNNESATVASTITVGTGGATIVATNALQLDLRGSGANPSTGTLSINAGVNTINIGVETPVTIDGQPKGGSTGEVNYGSPADSGGTAGLTAGAINVLSGRFQISGGGAFYRIGGGTGNITVSSGTLFRTLTGSTIEANVVAVAGSTVRASNSTTSTTSNYSSIQGAGSLIIGGDVTGTPSTDTTGTTARTFTTGANNLSTTFSGPISDNNSAVNGITFRKIGTGTLILSGSNNYDGPTQANAGTLQFGKLVSLYTNTPATWVVADKIVVATGATLALNVGGTGEFTSADVDTLKALGTATAGFATGSFLGLDTTNAGGNFTYTTPITNTNGATNVVGLTKLGTGTLTLSSVSTYTGATTVRAGVLSLDTGASIVSATTVNSGGQLRGLGTVNGTVSASTANAIVWPGTASNFTALTTNETLLVTGASVNLAGGGKLNTVVNSNGGVAGFKQLLQVQNAAAAFTVDSTSVLSFANDNTTMLNTASPTGYVIVETRDAGGVLIDGITTAFSTANILSGLQPADFDVIYRNALGADVATDPDGGIVTAAQIVLKFNPTNVSPVKIDAFTAAVEGAGVNVSWTAISEFKNAGFNVYRRAVETSNWVRANPVLIAGRITDADQKQYSFYDWASAGTYEYRLESVSIHGELENFTPLNSAVNIDWNEALTPSFIVSGAGIEAAMGTIAMSASVRTTAQIGAEFSALESTDEVAAESQTVKASVTPAVAIRNLSSEKVAVAGARENQHPAAARQVAATAGVRWFSSNSVAGSSSSYAAAKVLYSKPGVMHIPQSALPAGFNHKHVTLQREGRSFNALALTDGGLLVYAPGYQDDYTDKDALFLRRTAGATPAGVVTPAVGLFDSALTPSVVSPSTVTREFHDVYFDYSLRPYNFAPWFSNKYLSQGTTQDFTLDTPDAFNAPATLTLNLWSLTSNSTVNPDHALQVTINGRPVGQTTWDGGERMLQLTFSIPSGALNDGANTVSLTTPEVGGQTSQIAFLHSMSFGYTRTMDASSGLEFVNDSSSAKLCEVFNLPNANAWVVDTRFTDRATLVPTESRQEANGTYRTRFMAASGGNGKFLIVPQSQVNAPLSVSQRMMKPVRLTGTYLATGPSQFASSLQPLLAARAREGIRGAFVDQEQIFDFYNHGRYGPGGIQKAVRALKPQFLLLAGRTTYDYRNYSGAGVDPLCPTFLVTTSFWAQATSDSQFGDLGRGIPEVAVGRLPVNSATEMSAAVNRILSYKGVPASGIRVHAVADQADPETGNFAQQLSNMQSSNPDLSWQANYLGTTHQSATEVNASMTEAANGGADAILYAGHGNAVRLGRLETILDTKSVQNWTGNTVFLQATCTANWMAKNVPNYKSIAIQALTQPQGGISASVGTSTYMNPECAAQFMSELVRNAQRNPGMRWGQALMRTQQWAHQRNGSSAFYGDLGRTEQIFGDPAMRVFAPQPRLIGGGSSTQGTF